jgi:hypothetical protein
MVFFIFTLKIEYIDDIMNLTDEFMDIKFMFFDFIGLWGNLFHFIIEFSL